MKKSNNKGFTLVELIVVLVILAILAAILVPALLGYIDRAKGQQIVLNARSAYTAAQAEMTSKYAKSLSSNQLVATEKNRIAQTADISVNDATKPCEVTIYVAGAKDHAAYTVKYLEYKQDGQTIVFDGKEWDKDAKVPDAAKTNEVGTVNLLLNADGTGKNK